MIRHKQNKETFMTIRQLMQPFACAAFVLGAHCLFAADAPKDAAPPATRPAESAPDKAGAEVKTHVTPEAQKMMDETAKAYGELKSLDLTGTLNANFEAAGRKEGGTFAFTSSYVTPNKFRYAAKDQFLAGISGDQFYLYDKNRNAYLQAPAAKEKVATKDLPEPFPRIISMQQNASLLLALAKDPAADLLIDAVDVAKVEDSKLGDVAFPTLKVTYKDNTSVTLAIDPSTHLLRKTTADIRAQLVSNNVPDVKAASYTVDYESTTPDAPVKGEQFAWTPPAGAKDMKAAAPQEEQSPADALVGKNAPDFKLPGLDGKTVALADLKGKVVVLDMWATWCPPCRASLPHLDEFYQANKAAGVQVFAVNQAEEKDKVQAFVEKTKLVVPVLLDADGKVGESYKANAIPETVVIAKDGKVAKVFVGFDPNSTPEELHKVVDAELKK